MELGFLWDSGISDNNLGKLNATLLSTTLNRLQSLKISGNNIKNTTELIRFFNPSIRSLDVCIWELCGKHRQHYVCENRYAWLFELICLCSICQIFKWISFKPSLYEIDISYKGFTISSNLGTAWRSLATKFAVTTWYYVFK